MSGGRGRMSNFAEDGRQRAGMPELSDMIKKQQRE